MKLSICTKAIAGNTPDSIASELGIEEREVMGYLSELTVNYIESVRNSLRESGVSEEAIEKAIETLKYLSRVDDLVDYLPTESMAKSAIKSRFRQRIKTLKTIHGRVYFEDKWCDFDKPVFDEILRGMPVTDIIRKHQFLGYEGLVIYLVERNSKEVEKYAKTVLSNDDFDKFMGYYSRGDLQGWSEYLN